MRDDGNEDARAPAQMLDSVRLKRDSKVASELYFLILNRRRSSSREVGDHRQRPHPRYGPQAVRTGQSEEPAGARALAFCWGWPAASAPPLPAKALHQGVEDPAEIEGDGSPSTPACRTVRRRRSSPGSGTGRRGAVDSRRARPGRPRRRELAEPSHGTAVSRSWTRPTTWSPSRAPAPASGRPSSA